MYKNFYFLNRFIVEANEIIKGFHVESIFTQEKDILTIQLIKGDDRKFLRFSVSPGFPYITLTEDFKRAKKNSINIFPSSFSETLFSLEIAKYDRIVRINLTSSSIFFIIRGKDTNVIFTNKNGGIESFKKAGKDFLKSFLSEIEGISFSPLFSIPEIPKLDDDVFFPKIKAYPFISREILNELKFRTSENFFDNLVQILKEILTESPAVFLEVDKEPVLAVKTFHIFPFKDIRVFNRLIDALNYFLGKYFYLSDVHVKKNIIQKKLEHDLKKVTSRLNNLRSILEKESKEEEFNRIGNLLLININKIKKGMDEIELPDVYSGQADSRYRIKLKNNLSPKQNIDYYFDKSKSERINQLKSKELYSKSIKEFEKLKKIEDSLNKADTLNKYEIIMKEMNIKDRNKNPAKDDLQDKFKSYIIDNKYGVYVGKDSSNNDLLTTKFARSNDYWFHARGYPGSHVVLRVENSKEAIPKNILKKAASLAAFHSKAKTAGTVPVSFTLKKYVVKKKGMEPGKVALLREDTLLVKPEIPDGCEYIERD